MSKHIVLFFFWPMLGEKMHQCTNVDVSVHLLFADLSAAFRWSSGLKHGIGETAVAMFYFSAFQHHTKEEFVNLDLSGKHEIHDPI